MNGVQLHYVESGDENKPLILFVHGFPEFWFSWRHQIKYFNKVFIFIKKAFFEDLLFSTVGAHKLWERKTTIRLNKHKKNIELRPIPNNN